MLHTLWVCFLFSIAASAPVDDSQSARIISYENKNDGKGNYDFRFETSDGILRRESGVILHKGESDEHLSVDGKYYYTDPDGSFHVIWYQADRNGFEILPPPPAPVLTSVPIEVVATMLG